MDFLPRVYLGAHLAHTRVCSAKGRHVVVQSDSQLPLEMDSELVGTSDVELRSCRGRSRCSCRASSQDDHEVQELWPARNGEDRETVLDKVAVKSKGNRNP
ncbi:MAG: hypothetical protein EPO21_24430 [Chloroflexota bacterium]|nr:MAG: hypothetical protein EPO21_24430 [Chloroflexota bacterium]